MARRATFIQELRDSLGPGAPLLVLGGAQEFFDVRDTARRPKPRHALAYLHAYKAMSYDRVFVSPQEKTWLTDHAKAMQDEALMSRFTPLSPTASTTERFVLGGRQIAVIHFPLIEHNSRPSEDMLHAVRQEIREQARSSDLVVGMSHWGRQQEFTLLSNGVDGLDILLGAGAGPAAPDIIANKGRTLWARSSIKGRAVNVIQPLAWPKDIDRWRLDDSILASAKPLDGRITDDPAIQSLFNGPALSAPSP